MNKRSLLTLCLFLIIFGFLSLSVNAKGKDENKEFSLFIVGNSFSHNATRYLDTIASEGGYRLQIGRAEIGGGSLAQHWNATEAYERDSLSPAGRPYKGHSLKMLLKKGKWSVITLQQYSFLSSDSVSYIPFLKKLCDYILALQPQAEIVLHQTWAYRKDSPGFSMVSASSRARTQQEMWERSRRMYRHYAQVLKLKIIPVGDAFWAVDSKKQLGYKRDPRYNFDNPVYPHLPDQRNSLHVGYYWDKDRRLAFDSNHASEAGCYLGSLVWYAILFDRSPKKVAFKPAGLGGLFAESLRKEASKVVKAKEKV